MTRIFFWFTSIVVALWMTFAVELRTADATNYHIGVGQQYATLEAFRIAKETQGASSGSNAHLMDGDRLILHNDDHSLTAQLYVGYDSSVTILSNDPNQPRSISPAAESRTRLFYLDGSGNHWSKIYFEGINSISGGYSSYDGGAIYAWWHNDIYSLDGRGVTFENNFANGVGGAIYYWDALNCDLTDSNFINNKATGNGGALYINASGTLIMSDTTNVTIGASAGKTSTFSGNRDHVQRDSQGNYIAGSGTLNSIDFTGYNNNHVNLYIKTAEDGVLDMQDPFRTNQGYGAYTVNIEKTGTGTWKLGGESMINGSSGTTISIKEGTLELYRGAILNAAGSNDEFNVVQNAKVLLHGNNTITGTRVLFQQGAFLTFDMSYYFPTSTANAVNTNIPMLNLSGNTLQVSGTRIDIAELPNTSNRNGKYVLIQGNSTLEIGDFKLWIGNANIDVSGQVSDRFGYSLGYGQSSQGIINENQLVLTIRDTDNTVLKWTGTTGTNQWSVLGENWTLIRDDSTDSFVPGDTVQFFNSGNRTITLLETVAVGHNTVTEKATGQNWYGGNGDITGMHVSGNGNWTFAGSYGITDNDITGNAALLFDGSGIVTFSNNAANTYRGGTNLAGTGTLKVTRGDQLGLGTVNFLNNNTANQTTKLQFTGTTATTLGQQLIAEYGSNGFISIDNTKNLTVTRIAEDDETKGGAVYVKNGGVLEIQAKSTGRNGNIIFSKNGTKTNDSLLEKGAAVYVEDGGKFIVTGATFTNNRIENNGGIIDNEGKTTIQSGKFTENTGNVISATGNSQTTSIFDSTFTDNMINDASGVIYYLGSTGTSELMIGADKEQTTLFSGNKNQITGEQAYSVYVSANNGQTANLTIDTESSGSVDMLDPMFETGNGTFYVTKTGTGTWKLGGKNEFQSANFHIKEGKTDLYKTDTDKKITAGEIIIKNGEFEIGTGGILNSYGGNLIEAPTINLAGGATLGFDLSNTKSNNTALLTINTGNYLNLNNGQQNIDILLLDPKSTYGTFDLIDFNQTLTDAGIADIILLYHGEEMVKLRQINGELKLDNDKNTLQVEISQMWINGVTQWTNKTGNSLWDATSYNWKGISSDIIGTEQFLHGDAVIFTEEGAGIVTIIDGGVVIAPQGHWPGMTVNNSATTKIVEVDGEQKEMTITNDYTFIGGSISGTGALLKQGSGTLTLAQDNTFSGGTTIEEGKVVAKKITSLGTGNVSMNQDTTLEFSLDGLNGIFDQSISGDGQLIKSGGGALTLKNKDGEQNSYSGGTTVTGGTLVADGLETIGTGNIVIENISSVILRLTNGEEIFTKIISGTGSLQTEGTGQLTLSAENTYSGGTTIHTGSAIVAKNISATGSGNIQNDGKFVFDLTSNSGGTFEKFISGNGILEKTGVGLLELTQANTFLGTTILSAGTLRLSNELALQNSLLDYRGGKLDVGNLNRLRLSGLAGTQGISLSNDNENPIDLTIEITNENSVYNGVLAGKGSVTKIGSGTQFFAGKNTYSGGTEVLDGRLVSIGTAGFGSGDVVNNAEMGFQIDGGDESYKNVIHGTGSLWKSGTGTLKLTGENTYSGGTFIEDGTIAVSKINSLGTGNISLQHATSALSFNFADEETVTQMIGGAGSISKTGAGTLFFETALETTGKLDIFGGSVFINANADTETTVYDGATLGGRGFIGNKVTFLKGATQLIGKSQDSYLAQFGAKNIAYEDGSTVYIKIGMNGNDQVVASEGFNFAQGGGVVTVRLINLSLDDYDPETVILPKEYDVFIADGGKLLLDGERIPNIESDSDTLTVEGVDGAVRFVSAPDEELGVIGYTVKASSDKGRNITLNIATTGPGAIAYLNENQRSTLRAMSDAEIFNGIYSCSLEYRGAAIDQTMPFIQTAMPFITERSITQFNLATFERLRFLREPVALTDREINAYRGSSHRFAHLHTKANYLWFQNFGDFLRMNSHGGIPEFQADSYGYTFGVDRGINYHSSIGIGMGGYVGDVKANGVYQQADINSFQFSLYGNWVNDDNWMMTGSLGIVFTSYDLERKVPLFETILNSRHSGMTSFVSLEGSKKLLFGKYEVSPYFGTDFIWLGENGYREHASTGLDSLALNVRSHDTFSVLTSAGVRLGRSMRLMGGNIVSPSLYAAWIHDWTENNISATASFMDEPAFKIRGASMNSDRAQVGTNINMTLSKRSDMFARFNAELGNHYNNLSFHWGIRFGY